VDIREGEQSCCLGAPFLKDFAGPLFETFVLFFFGLFCLKADEPLWSRKLWSKSDVFQNKAKNVRKRAL